MEVEVLISSLDEGEGEGYMARIWGKSVEMGDRQFFADFYRMNASPLVFFLSSLFCLFHYHWIIPFSCLLYSIPLYIGHAVFLLFFSLAFLK